MSTISSLLFSVVICTYNRAEILSEAIKTACEQEFDSEKFEVIVVDNNSSDSTSEIIEKYKLMYPNLKSVIEPKQGLSNARNLGWRIARGLYVAYIDDDSKVSSDWLSKASRVVEKYNPAVFGGPILPFYRDRPPSWFKDSYVIHKPYEDTRELNRNDADVIFGGNMIWRRDILDSLNGFKPELGMNGNKPGYGEETQLLRQLSANKLNEKIYYIPELFAYHLVQVYKYKMIHIVKASFRAGRDFYHFEPKKNHSISRVQILRKGLRIIRIFGLDMVKKTITRDKTEYPYFRGYFYKQSTKYIRQLGRIYEQLKYY